MAAPSKRDMEGRWVSIPIDALDQRPFPESGSLFDLENVQYDAVTGLWSQCNGVVSYTPSYAGGDIVAMHFWQPAENIRYLLVQRRTSEEESKISWLDVRAGGTHTDISTRRHLDSSPAGTTFIDFGRFILFASPFDGIQRWDGQELHPLGFAGPPSFSVAGPKEGFDAADRAWSAYATPIDSRDELLQRGVGEYPGSANEAWRYGYVMTVFDDMGNESPPSAMVFASGLNTNDSDGRRTVLVRVPRQPDNVVAVRIHRTLNLVGSIDVADTARVYHLITWPCSNEFIWMDHYSDSELVLELDTSQLGAVPQGVLTASLWQGSLWVFASDDPSALRASYPGLIGQFPASLRFPVGFSRTGRGVSITPIQRGLLVGKAGGLYVVKGTYPTWRVETLTEEEGVASAASVVVVPQAGVFFVSPHGPRLLVGTLEDDETTRVVPLDKTAKKLWAAAGDLTHCRAAYDPGKREVWVSLSAGNDGRKGKSLVWQVDTQTWSRRDGWYVGAMEFYRGRMFLGMGNAAVADGVMAVTGGSYQDPSGTLINARITTSPIETIDTFTAQSVEVLGLAAGSLPLTLETRSNRAQSWTTQTNQVPQHPTTYTAGLWGEALWDDGSQTLYWGAYEPAAFRVSVHLDEAYSHGLRVSGVRLALKQLNLDTPPGRYRPRPTERQ